ncbi:PREDICTED: desumoylating isopeptidase 1-like [Ipomoea nil]|uniref:desumoylating isopeptidase 1-like n=1 Tax=Ipomoea nil TaxID=35883 RepID=UPI000900E694|nr:PREDICTED: desumoylating isopeptidase 1-like [Ipomoea nil]
MAEETYSVMLNVYDLSQGLAKQLSSAFLGTCIEGIWHTGVVVYGYEYYFGGGIQHEPAGCTPYGTPLRVIDLGTTEVTKDVFEMYLQEISPRYRAETYNLMAHNCNNFSNEVAQFLVGTTIPDYILDLPNEVMNSPMGPLMLPMIKQLETTLRDGAVPKAPQFVLPAEPLAFQTGVCADQSKKVEEAEVVMSGEQSANSVDPLGDARSKIQGEITQEFAAIMATGTLRASEAAALATKRVMERYGHTTTA